MTDATRGEPPDFIRPIDFGAAAPAVAGYTDDPDIARLIEFFQLKGLPAQKEEDRLETWYADWIAFQARHRLYARLLSPRKLSSLGTQFDLLKITRFLEVFGYFSPGHGYSLQVTFLGLFGILMGDNDDLKREAVCLLEEGKLLAFGVSEREHGSDLLGNEFRITPAPSGGYLASGSKYYIGNSNAAAMICTLARKEIGRAGASARRVPFALIALRPDRSPGLQNARKIRTLGVRAAYVGAFDVSDQPVADTDVIAEGRRAWDAVLGAVTLGKFFLGFGSIGICEHAFQEARDHLASRIIAGKPVIEMPHIRSAMCQAYARLSAMKLFAYRALDYLHAASADDRRYLLFNAVQKAKLSVEGVRCVSLLSECVGAKGFESDTYFEMALRDIQLIPGLEGSTHINLSAVAQFVPAYFAADDARIADPPSLVAGQIPSSENEYLTEARAGSINGISFKHCRHSFTPLADIRNVQIFVRQIEAFSIFILGGRTWSELSTDLETSLIAARCVATIAYAQLVAENAKLLGTPGEMISQIFEAFIMDLGVDALTLSSRPKLDGSQTRRLRRCVRSPATTRADRDYVARLLHGDTRRPK